MSSVKKIKILRITTVTHSLHLLLRGQLNYMAQNDMEVYMASSYSSDVPYLEKFENSKHYSIPLTRRISPIKDFIALVQLIRLLREIKPDIVHSHSPKAGIIGMLAAKICGINVKLHTVAGLPLMEAVGLKLKLLRRVEKITYYCADKVLPNSNKLKDYIVAEGLIADQNKLYVIGKGSSNGIDLSYFDSENIKASYLTELKLQHSISSEDIILCFVGRLANYKGINELVAAFQILNRRYEKLKLLLVGPIEDLNPLDEETLRFIDRNKNIITTGHINDIRPYLAIAHIFTFPSYREGFPQSLMQASAMKLPCIATDINGCNEIVFENINGYLIRPKNVDDIVNTCIPLIESKELRERFGDEGYMYIKNNFDQKLIWSKLLEFYHQCLNQDVRISLFLLCSFCSLI